MEKRGEGSVCVFVCVCVTELVGFSRVVSISTLFDVS